MIFQLKIKNNQLKNKKRQAYYIAPLQPLTLAAFPPWEGSAGAGRVRPAGRKYTEKFKVKNPNFNFFWRILVKQKNLFIINTRFFHSAN